MMLTVIATLDACLTRHDIRLGKSFRRETRSSVQCRKYENKLFPTVTAYLEVDILPDETRTCHFDIDYEEDMWVITRHISCDSGESETLVSFEPIKHEQIGSLMEILISAVEEGLMRFETELNI